MKFIRTTVYLSIVFVLISIPFGLPGQSLDNSREEATEDKLKYEVSVDAQLVPVFVVDKDGNPVFDLKKEDFQLYADNEPVEIISFSSYRREGQEKQKPETVKAPERMNFIILDTLISNRNLLGITRAIAMGIIEKSSPGDSFIILESNQITGLQYVTGPEKDKKLLFKALKKIEKRYMTRDVTLAPDLARESQRAVASNGPARETAMLIMAIKMVEVERERQRYRRDIRTLADSIQQLKYALKTIKLPKTVFLISTGPMKFALGELPVTSYRYLEDAAKAVNFGGALFYMVNPLAFKRERQRTDLKFVTDNVAGKFIHGASFPEIIDNVGKSTSAYYEMAFQPVKKDGLKSRIRVECKRKGMEPISLAYSEKSTPYPRMKLMEKKLFALNVVTDGSWSRMVSKVGRVKYKRLNPGIIEINVPPAMRNRRLDVFRVHVDPQTQKARFEFEKRVMGKNAQIRVTPMENRDSYFVIIEPETPICIYNRV